LELKDITLTISGSNTPDISSYTGMTFNIFNADNSPYLTVTNLAFSGTSTISFTPSVANLADYKLKVVYLSLTLFHAHPTDFLVPLNSIA
jgi:hypothetical protein